MFLENPLELRQNNPYANGTIFQFEEGDILLDRIPVVAEKSTGDRYYTIKQFDTLSILSGKFYGNSKYWWILMDVNDIEWPFELEIGKTILIPDINKIGLD